MLHNTQTTKKHTGNLILRFGMAGLLAAGLFFSAPYSAAAETVPSAENTDAGEITIHFTHYDAQDLEFYLNTDQAALAFTDATLTFQDSTMDAPVTMSYLSDDGSYVLYQNSEPVEEVNGTFSVSMVTEPGYTLDMDQISFYVNGQAVSNGGSVVITDSSAAMTSLVYCTAIPETPATDPEPSLPEEPSAPEVPEEPAAPEPSVPEQPSAPAETPTMVRHLLRNSRHRKIFFRKPQLLHPKLHRNRFLHPNRSQQNRLPAQLLQKTKKLIFPPSTRKLPHPLLLLPASFQPQRRLYHLSEQQTRMHRFLLRKLQLLKMPHRPRIHRLHTQESAPGSISEQIRSSQS